MSVTSSSNFVTLSSVSSALNMLADTGKISSDAFVIAQFCEDMNMLWDMINSNS